MLWRLTQNWQGLPEGSCITEEKLKSVYYTDKTLFEPVQDYEERDMIKYEDDELCMELGIEKLLFYTERELDNFVEKLYNDEIN